MKCIFTDLVEQLIVSKTVIVNIAQIKHYQIKPFQQYLKSEVAHDQEFTPGLHYCQ